MGLRKLILAFLLMTAASSAATSLSDWKPLIRNEATEVWQSRSNPNQLITLDFHPDKEEKKWREIKDANFFKNFSQEKSKTLSYMGIQDWNPLDYEWKRKKRYHKLRIKGSYFNAYNEQVHFLEVHYYFKKKNFQLLFTSLKELDDKALEDKIVPFLKGKIDL